MKFLMTGLIISLAIVSSGQVVGVDDPSDMADSSGDIKRIEAWVDEGNLNLTMTVYGVFAPSVEETPEGMSNRYYYHWILDTDNDPATGFLNDEYEGNPTNLETPIGVDVLIQFGWRDGATNGVYAYTFDPLTGDEVELFEDYEYTIDGDTIHAVIPLEDLGLELGQTIAVSGFQEGASNDWQVDWVESFELTLEDTSTIYVDDNAPSDPGPQDPDISDPNEDGTQEHPFDMIQEAIDAAKDGDTVVVLEGLYLETINFNGKSITVTSFDPNAESEEPLPYPIIDGNGQGPVVTFNHGEDPNTELSGLEIRGGVAFIGSAIQCVNSSPKISNCLIVGNRILDPNDGSVIYFFDSNSVVENCTIADNSAGKEGTCIYMLVSDVTISNCIIWGNTPQQIVVGSGNDPIVVYCDVQGEWPGEGNIDSDPLFAYMGYWADSNDPNLMPTEPNDPNAIWIEGDYHVMSIKGRWDPVSMSWVKDKSMSPCVDAGDPASPYANEPEPNGERVNMGAYGGTTQASLTRILYTLTLTSSNGGSVTGPGEGTFTYDEGTQVQVSTKADSLYYFLKWTGSAVDAGKVANPISPNLTIVMDRDYSLRASFVSVCFNLTASSTDGGSITEPGEGYFTVCGNFLIPLEAVADPHYHFVNWTGTSVDAENVVDPDGPVTSIFVLGNYAVVANFAIDTHTLTISSTDGGSVTTPGEGSFEYDYGTVVDVAATADEHYHFVNWTGTAVDAGMVADPTSSSTTVTVEADYTLTANFEIDTYTLTISSTCGGSVTTPGEGAFEYDYGTVVDLVAVADCSYQFKCWSGPVADPASACTTVTLMEDTCVGAVFEKKECVCIIDDPVD